MQITEKWLVEQRNDASGSGWVVAPGTTTRDQGQAIRLARYLANITGIEHRTRKLDGQAYQQAETDSEA